MTVASVEETKIDFSKDILQRATKFANLLNFKFKKCRGWRMVELKYRLNETEPMIDLVATLGKKKKRMDMEVSFMVSDIIMNREACVKEFMRTVSEELAKP